jgi:chaperone required for assembly of F1-ATPase
MSDDRSSDPRLAKKGEGLASDFLIEAKERDPLRAAAKAARPQLPRRFYEKVAVAPIGDGFAVLLDGKPVRTPARRTLAAPTAALAEALAEEWSSQGEWIDPAAMPLTRLFNSAIDGVADRLAEVEADIVKYAGSDLICYRAGAPESLSQAQAAKWDPLLRFARDALGARLALAEGVVFTSQAPEAVAAIAERVRDYVGVGPGSPLRLAALHAMTTLTGSCVIALAVALGRMDADEAWDAASVDEDFQMAAWGEDAEALARRERRLQEMRAAALISRAFAG